MLQRLKNSLKYRLFFAYCRGLERTKKRQLTKLDWPGKFRDDLPPLVVVTSRKDIPLLLYSLRSLRDAAAAVPEVWLAGDSNESANGLKNAFPEPPKNLKIIHWELFFDELRPAEKRFVETWKNSKPWGGYARKFAVTLAANRKSAVLLSDADVLWKQDFLPRLEQLLGSNPTILAGLDHDYSYDREMAGALRSEIFSAPPLNCGFVYYSRDILGRTLNESVYAVAQSFAARASTHLEQTLIAHAFQMAGGQLFKTEEVAVTLADSFCLKEKVSSAVRHYAGAKVLFWRDA